MVRRRCRTPSALERSSPVCAWVATWFRDRLRAGACDPAQRLPERDVVHAGEHRQEAAAQVGLRFERVQRRAQCLGRQPGVLLVRRGVRELTERGPVATAAASRPVAATGGCRSRAEIVAARLWGSSIRPRSKGLALRASTSPLRHGDVMLGGAHVVVHRDPHPRRLHQRLEAHPRIANSAPWRSSSSMISRRKNAPSMRNSRT